MSDLETRHIPVLRDEVLEHLLLEPDFAGAPALLLDCTLGGGGHSFALLEQDERFFLIGLDQDEAALRRTAARLAPFAGRTILQQSSFKDARAAVRELGEPVASALANGAPFARILIDLGISSDQLDDGERGFSFSGDGPLDMRMDRSKGITAAEICNTYSVPDLRRVFLRGGVGEMSNALAQEIERRRPVTTTAELAEICKTVGRRMPRDRGKKEHNKATVPFQALRIEVNDELGSLSAFLDQVPDLLAPSGKLAIISFHSLEDKVVAQQMRKWSQSPKELRRLPVPGTPETFGTMLTKQAVTPSSEEIAQNPRARSARMRVFKRNTTVQ